ncbi:MAG: hypothetical protein ACQEUZ_03805 [Pseudomonadota bacterium]
MNVNKLNRDGSLKPGFIGERVWYSLRDGRRTASIGLHTETDRLVLSFRSPETGGAWVDIEQSVAITREPCRYGGSRPYFLCPKLGCGRRVVKLFKSGHRFLCRQCHGLVYESQAETAWKRRLRRANKLRERLGGPVGMLNRMPWKPPQMHTTTYEQMVAEIRSIEEPAIRRLATELGLET